MGGSNTKNTPQMTEHMLNTIEEELIKPLTQWEQDFVESARAGFLKYGSVTDKMFKMLERIYAEKTA